MRASGSFEAELSRIVASIGVDNEREDESPSVRFLTTLADETSTGAAGVASLISSRRERLALEDIAKEWGEPTSAEDAPPEGESRVAPAAVGLGGAERPDAIGGDGVDVFTLAGA